MARLEDAGYIEELQRRVIAEPELEADTRRAQLQYISEFKAAVVAGGDPEPEQDIFIAAAKDPLLLKCLHAHMAFYLAHKDYLLGGLVAQAVGRLWCPDERCAVWTEAIMGEETS